MGELSEAKRLCLLDRCVRKTVKLEKSERTYMSDEGQHIELETFHIGCQPYWQLTHYGCNVAVTPLC